MIVDFRSVAHAAFLESFMPNSGHWGTEIDILQAVPTETPLLAPSHIQGRSSPLHPDISPQSHQNRPYQNDRPTLTHQ